MPAEGQFGAIANITKTNDSSNFLGQKRGDESSLGMFVNMNLKETGLVG